MVMMPATMERDTTDLVRRAQQGDVDAFEGIYRLTSAKVYSLCRRMSRDDSEARELLQDVFVRAWERLATFRGQSALTTWLHRVAVNVALEQIRTRQREARRFVDDGDAMIALHHIEAAPDANIDLESAMNTLAPGARAVFALHLEGYSHDEIAQMTGIAAGTARAQLWRARRALTRLLDR